MRLRPWLPRCRRVLRHSAHALSCGYDACRAASPLLQAALAAVLLTAALLLLRAAPPRPAPAVPEAGIVAARAAAAECVAWRATRCGSVLAERVPMEDLPCYATIRPRGFCECAAQRVPSIAVARACGETALIWHLQRAAARSFTCAEQCARSAGAASPPLAVAAPACRFNVTAPPRPRVQAPPPLPAADAAALHDLWRSVDAAFQAAGGLDVVLPPGHRGIGARPDNDFVAAGARMPAADVARAAAQWRAFAASHVASAYPPARFAGRGIVIGGGGLRYMMPAWAALRALRRANCTLPVEVWFPAAEAPPPGSGLEAALRDLGAAVRSTAELAPGGGGGDLFRRYAFKAAALLFSRFEEALWLDADNVALRDPEAAVFESPAFRAAGLLLWRDHWKPSTAPDAAAVLGLAADAQMPPWTCESGQLALNKRLAWQPALLALFFNMQGPLYYRLLSSYMGAGDKETWPAAAAALRRPAAWVAQPPGAAGVPWPEGAARPSAVRSNAMLQHAPEDGGGGLLFVHSNYFKWDLQDMPLLTRDGGDTVDEPPRRWRVMTPPGWDAESAAVAEAAGSRTAWRPAAAALRSAAGGADPEAGAWADLLALRCASWFGAYAAERRTRHGELMPERLGGGTPRVFKGVVLSEHAGGRYTGQ